MRRILFILLIVVVAAGVVVVAMYRRDIGAAYARLEAGTPSVVETSFGRLEYAETGEGEPVLAIHGTGGGYDQGMEMAGPLGEGRRLITPSRFGYLGSAMPAGATIEMQADAFDELMDKLGIDRAVIFGGSAGALSALQLAIRHPARCRALVLLVPASYVPVTGTGAGVEVSAQTEAAMKAVLGSDFLFWAGMTVFPDAMTRILLATKPEVVDAASPQEQARASAILRHILPVSIRAQGLMFDMRTAGAPEPMDLGRILCPVLAISVEDDLFGTAKSARHIAASVRNGRVVIYSEGGHVWLGHQDEVWAEVDAFLASEGGQPTAALQ